MKKIIIILILFSSNLRTVNAQWYEATVLLLNFEKYYEIKKTYDEISTTYKVLKFGYDKIKGVADGDVQLHQAFLDGLKAINPSVANYHRVYEIYKKQRWLIKQYSPYISLIYNSNKFSEEEIKHLKKVVDALINSTADNIDDLLRIITATNLNMTDEQRIKLIDDLDSKLNYQVNYVGKMFEQVSKVIKFREGVDKENDLVKNISTDDD